MAQDAAGDVLGTAKDGSAKVIFVVPIAIFQRRNTRQEGGERRHRAEAAKSSRSPASNVFSRGHMC